MTRKQEETKAVKHALRHYPHRVKIRHGTGTASGWIKAYIPRAIWEEEKKVVEIIIAAATHRGLDENNHILVTWYE